MEYDEALAGWILEQTSDALIYADSSGIIRRWNAAAGRLFGFEPKEALGQSLDIIIPEYLRVAHWAGFHAAIDNGTLRLEGRPTLTRGLHKNGGKLYVEMTFALVKNPAGQAIGSVAMARDATERTLKEKERAQNERAGRD